jgi:hypothetical protein
MCGSKDIKEIKEVNIAWRKCSIEGCDKHAHSDGLCDRHYREKHGRPYKSKSKKERQKCKIDGCEKYPVKEGYCTGHYKEKNGEFPKKSVRHEQPGARPKPTPNPPKKAMGAKLVAVTPLRKGDGTNMITVDFVGNDGLLQKIIGEAKSQFRPVEYQILYLLNIATTEPSAKPVG